MTKLSTDTIRTVGRICDFPGVAGSAEWNDRVYIRLDMADRSFAGDRNLKIWVRGNRVTIEGRKGTTSSGFHGSFMAFLDALTAATTKLPGHPGTCEGVYQFD